MTRRNNDAPQTRRNVRLGRDPKESFSLHPFAPYLLYSAIARAGEGHGVAAVIVGGHRGQAVILVDEERYPFYGAGPAQRLVKVLAAEVVVDLKRLNERGEREKCEETGKTVCLAL